MKILFTGGGTLGPVTPLLAVAEVLRRHDAAIRFAWAGTAHGPERVFVEAADIPFYAVPVARLTRYPSWEWPLFPLRAASAFLRAFFILRREKPNLVASAGGFTGVPFVFLARFMHIPSWIHQPDVTPVLSNRLCAKAAALITVAWPESVAAFPAEKTVVTGHPVRASLSGGDAQAARKHFGLSARRPVVLVLGGGGGAQWINRAFEDGRDRVHAIADVIHVTGRGKLSDGLRAAGPGYVPVELLGAELADAYAVADIVVARAGMGTLAELAALGKPCVLVPLPNSPQGANARAAAVREAAIVIPQERGPSALIEAVVNLLADKEKQRQLSKRIQALLAPDATNRVAAQVERWLD